MSKSVISTLFSVLFIVASIGLLLFPKTSLFERFSPQATVNPYNLSDTYESDPVSAVFNNREISAPDIPLFAQAAPVQNKKVLGESTGNKRIEVDLTAQRLYAYEGDRKVYDFLVSTGKWGRTPTGDFEIWIKLRSTKMEGGNKSLRTYYYLPNVPYVMYFANSEIPKWKGYGIHGAYWHNNFGRPMSHGCINMKPEEAGILYEWASPNLNGKSSGYASAENPGTRIRIYGTAPTS